VNHRGKLFGGRENKNEKKLEKNLEGEFFPGSIWKVVWRERVVWLISNQSQPIKFPTMRCCSKEKLLV